MTRPFALVPPEPDVHVKGDKLGRSYTPLRVAEAVLMRLRPRLPERLLMFEPCVGGGAFVKAARRLLDVRGASGFDLDGSAPGAADCDDFMVTDSSMVRASGFDLSASNPPWARR